ncbi:hypothetical protein PORY_002478 [Pneumocystis oryctolagi]|uniref:Uncharacterized protein n=1 Tax=Pneumocystis oryctolagi TaxID=42067 RepID=A0ACB7CGI0_9ASCO|nr:hypothetical protein PORY_002478 [Pneumocystis oryctolagi]
MADKMVQKTKRSTNNTHNVLYSFIDMVFDSSYYVFIIGGLLRLFFLVYGYWHDSQSSVKYTDIDYSVFTGAAELAYNRRSVYDRETYRYTPLLAWLLIPNVMGFPYFGKILFSICDLIAGYLMKNILIFYKHSRKKINIYTATWLWNPFVIVISTRGNAESMIGMGVLLCLWVALSKRPFLTGCLLGIVIHLKLYAIIYIPTFLWAMDNKYEGKLLKKTFFHWITYSRVCFILAIILVSGLLNGIIYKMPFLNHTYFYHFIRTDHRHNFSPYHLWLYYTSSPVKSFFNIPVFLISFIPQMLLSMGLIPVAFAKKNLPGTMFSQTFAFVTFNKVCTSQYFMWYLILLPFMLPSFNPFLGLLMIVFWISAQGLWLLFAYHLEFLGINVYVFSESSALRNKEKIGPFTWKSGALFLLTGAGLTWYFKNEKEKMQQRRKENQNRSIGNAKIGGPFELTDHNGKNVTNKDFLGKYMLIYFGFTRCPDICPEELDKMASIINCLLYVNNKKNAITPIFITCDPNRDTPSLIKEYLQEFHPQIIGLTGTYESIKAVCKAYRVYFSTPPDIKPGDDYLVDHSIFFYLMNPDGQFQEVFGRHYTAEQIGEKILQHVYNWEKLHEISSRDASKQAKNICLDEVTGEYVSKTQDKKEVAFVSSKFSQINISEINENLTPNVKYYELRLRAINALRESKDPNPYPHKFHVNTNLPDFIKLYSSLKRGEVNKDVVICVSGRIRNKRELSSKLRFYDLYSDGVKVQVMAQAQDCEKDYLKMHEHIQRGDIVGIIGYPGRTAPKGKGKDEGEGGELSVFCREIILLSPCLHMLPMEHYGLTNQETRYRHRYLDLIINKSTREKFIMRAKVIQYIRKFLDSLDFLEVETPMMNMIPGGARGYIIKYHPNGPEGEEICIDFSRPWRRIEIISFLEEKLSVVFPPGDQLHTEETNKFLKNLCEKHGLECLPPTTNPRLLDRLISEFLEPLCINPTFLIGHPQVMSPLAKYHRSKPGLCERFEVFVASKEIINAYTELNDPVEQRLRFEEQARQKDQGDDEVQIIDENFCTALEYGLPPTGGWGMGIDRLVMFLTDSNNIKEVLLFPAMKPDVSN